MKFSALFYFTGADITVKEISGKVFLQCQTTKEEQKKDIVWKKGEYPVGNMTQLDLGAIYDDPRGIYTCLLGGNDKPSPLQVYYRSECLKLNF